mgnify:FL=1|jgi:hypothetical protein
MNNQSARGFYNITETIKSELLKTPNVKTVTVGDLADVDLSKQTIFPLSHIVINNVTLSEQTMDFNITILACDIVNQSKEETTDLFRGNNNVQDILNTQLLVVNTLIQKLRMGNLYADQYQLNGDPSAEPFYDRFENELAGFSATMNISIANDINICINP